MPIAPYSGMGGVKPRLTASASTASRAGSTPEPPVPSWLALIASMPRATSGASSGPVPAAWLRSSRNPCSARSRSLIGTTWLAPTPVVRPYTGRSAATSWATCQAARAAASAAAATATVARCRATAAT